eukprot:gnl/MRDRNA2_/MRDRNA2_102778_c0_seq1.p1 gnl/MRDRNA2_/MRDRNA2_102778_c0~~gnl/MRDRNA2_/MRDRNA2_102778_c0_seq1.p1  ORF type:complete len:380 (+),score=71.04 gnl/MRDRNA2_/MRDRNA2_102778_c0_seq1:115-1254(+)
MMIWLLTYPLAASAVALSNELLSYSNARVMRDNRPYLAESGTKMISGTSTIEPLDTDDGEPENEENNEEIDQTSDEEALKILHDVVKKLPKPSAKASSTNGNRSANKLQTKPVKPSSSDKMHDVSGVLHPNDAPEIPRIIHHVYKTDISKGAWPNTPEGTVWKTSYGAWLRFFPSPWYKHMFWDDNASINFFLQHCPKQYSTYESAQEIVRADLIRYCILKMVGGIYADLDYEPRANFYSDLDATKVNLIQSPYKSETFQNSLMASRAGHPYWEEVLHQAMIRGPVQNDVLSISGPCLLESLNMTFDIDVVNPLPCNSFQRATHLLARENEAAAEKHCMRLSVDAVNDQRLKGIHWGTVSWMKGNSEYMRLYTAFHSSS